MDDEEPTNKRGDDMAIAVIKPEEACLKCPPESLGFTTTLEVEKVIHIAGQDRAMDSVEFGIGIEKKGFNLFVIGPQGSGRHTVIRSFIDQKAMTGQPPRDWCYVNNFQHPHKPLALDFERGAAVIFKKEVQDLVDLLKVTLGSVFEGEDYKAKIKNINQDFQNKVDTLYHDIEANAKRESIGVVKSEQGIMVAPIDGNGEVLDSGSYLKLPDDTRKRIDKLVEKYQNAIQDGVQQITLFKREAEAAKKKLKTDLARQVVSGFTNTLKQKYQNREKLQNYFQDVEDDIVEHVDDFLYRAEDGKEQIMVLMNLQAPSFERYEVNLLVANGNDSAPVVYEDLPNYQNLHGRIEHLAKMGMLSTHFTLIKPGSLHMANGGYIIIDARRLLTMPYGYEGLKRTLRSGQIRIEPLERILGLMSTVTLEPEPIPLRAKVVLIGDAWLYYLLKQYDPEFDSLFKVQVDFEHAMDRTPENLKLFASLVTGMIQNDELRQMDASGVARLVEYSSRKAEDSGKISLFLEHLDNVIKEADYIAQNDGCDRIGGEQVQKALDAAEYRSCRLRDRMFEMTEQNIRYISTKGEVVGQVNGLSVLTLASYCFGLPCRITALTRPGKEGELIDIEKKVELGGPIHSKGVLILESFMRSRYLRSMPIGFRASLVFEQSYGGVDGDSASCAELCALLSSLADVPIKQSIAITGSVSQKGEVQAIGGVNEKIEGFYDLCKSRGLDGSHGVIIPAANRRHMMVKQEVIKAMEDKQFFIWSVEHVDDAVELLTGLAAGERDGKGNYPDDCINGRVEETLKRFVTDMRDFTRPPKTWKKRS
ncbi:Lon protease family protein [Desulfopila sp. IMCC35008]|uniref:Lon protease family protein n=1 Tax=Desulfopila sp. IMCC35008 TaxID=2653858 RepID=UPI0013CF81A3|nr:ATP-binding protein [Desulfopila sp. IMCC35008]